MSLRTRRGGSVSSPGWTVRPVTVGFTVQRGEQTTTTGARAGRVPIEHFTHAKMDAPRGSAVYASIPCNSTEASGVGAAQLTGPVTPLLLQCNAGTAWRVFADHPTRTTWRLDGDVLGSGGTIARLAKLDYPA